MKVLDTAFAKAYIRVTMVLTRNWHERNGGNLSYRIKHEEVESVKEGFLMREAGLSAPVFLPGRGVFHGVGKRPGVYAQHDSGTEANCCIIEWTKRGELPDLLGSSQRGRPTSGLPTHLMNHEVKKKATEGDTG